MSGSTFDPARGLRGLKANRRTVLRGLLGGATAVVALPMLEAFLGREPRAQAQSADGFPSRFGLFMWGNGILPDRWAPPNVGPGWTPSPLLEPLAHLAASVTVVTGMKVATPNSVPHFAGAAGFLTGTALMDEYEGNSFSGPSLDQLIAAEIGKTTRFKSLEFGAEPGGGLSFNGINSRNPPERDPHALFQRLFGEGFRAPGDGPSMPDPTLALRRSVLDVMTTDIRRLQALVSGTDRGRLEHHFEGIRAMELRLAALEADPPALAACLRPEAPPLDFPDVLGRPLLHEKNAAFCDLVAMALACDQTRVFFNQFTGPVSNHLFPDATSGHHQLTHDELLDQPEVFAITRHCVQAFARQVEALAAIPEGDGTLLDHCLLLGTSDVSLGKTHSFEDFPILIAGSGGGRIKSGLHYRSPSSENTGKVPLSLMRALGIDAASFGKDEGETAVGLSEIEV